MGTSVLRGDSGGANLECGIRFPISPASTSHLDHTDSASQYLYGGECIEINGMHKGIKAGHEMQSEHRVNLWVSLLPPPPLGKCPAGKKKIRFICIQAIAWGGEAK